jgi:hypothetical protein
MEALVNSEGSAPGNVLVISMTMFKYSLEVLILTIFTRLMLEVVTFWLLSVLSLNSEQKFKIVSQRTLSILMKQVFILFSSTWEERRLLSMLMIGSLATTVNLYRPLLRLMRYGLFYLRKPGLSCMDLTRELKEDFPVMLSLL